MTKSGPRWSLGNASTGQKLSAGALALIALLVMANGDGEADATARGMDASEELASPVDGRGPRLTYARRPSADDDEFKAPPRRRVRQSPEPEDAPRSDEDVPRLTYLPKDDLEAPPVTPSFEPSPPATTVQETTEATPAAPVPAPAAPGRTASGGSGPPVGQLARTGAAATLTALAGVGLVYTGTSLRDRIRRARTRPYGRTVPVPGDGRPCAYDESHKLKKQPK